MLTRRIARPLLAAWFVSEGLDALRRPEPHAARTEASWREVGRHLDLPPAPSPATFTLLVKVHGATMAVAGLLLALGRAPRAAALLLAALTAPLAVVNQPFGASARVVATAGETAAVRDGSGSGQDLRSRVGRAIGATGGVSSPSVRPGGVDRTALRERFVRTLSMTGGALIAGLDTEGRPGVAWRASHARVDRAAAREARAALAAAAKEVKAAAREARRSA
ncbi:MAG: DoxX family protein [Actinotalea sp.]|nr:DoxX family protein [Actinotalea sp.]